LKKTCSVKPDHKQTFKAYDGINNLFNSGYQILNWKLHKALVNAKLEPYLGFLHSEQFSKPSLVCDFMEIYRYIIDDFVISFCFDLSKKDFITKNEVMSRGKVGKREYLNDAETKKFNAKLNDYFETLVEIPRMKIGEKQTIETLINEEAYLFAKYLRKEKSCWEPRIRIDSNSVKLLWKTFTKD